MGKTIAQKREVIDELKASLDGVQMVMAIDSTGLTVAEVTKLRRTLKASGTLCKSTKNTLMRKAIAEVPQWQSLDKFLTGTTACLIVKEDIGGAIKAYQAFVKESKKTELRGGVLEGRALTSEELKAIADLPSKEVLLGQLAGAINGVATKLAVAVKEVPQSLARVIKAIHEKEAA